MTDVMTEDGMVQEYRTSPLAVTVDEYEAVCQRLGLGAGTTGLLLTTPVKTADQAALHYPEWKGRTLRAWRKFIPTVYRAWNWDCYHFDKPPLRALKAIEAAVELDVFERLEIWTPEHRRLRRGPIQYMIDEIDPVCVGVVTSQYGPSANRYFPIVRWGAEELVSERRVRLTSLFLRDPRYY